MAFNLVSQKEAMEMVEVEKFYSTKINELTEKSNINSIINKAFA